jgi:uncharacterized membrane protein YfcA
VDAFLGILAGFVAGALGGAFGVGGAIVTTPAVEVLLGAPPLIAVGTPLPVIFPTTISGMQAYRRAGLIDGRAVRWLAPPGAVGAVGGALLTAVVDPHLLLLVTALLIGWQAVRIGWTRPPPEVEEGARTSARATPLVLTLTGFVAGFASGLLGIGGGVVLVPAMSGLLRMPLKRALGTSLVVIAVMVIPGTLVHWALGHIDWAIFLYLSLGVVPGAQLGSRWTIRARERTLRITVAIFLGAVALAYAGLEIHHLVAKAATTIGPR